MQILGKRSKVLLIAVAIIMLVAIGVSFAIWDISAVKATSGDLSSYANAKVGDIIEFGRYYQTGNKVSDAEDAEYEKTPIEWIVVDKDERTGQLTLMSKYILACGSYFGNWYYNAKEVGARHYNLETIELSNISYNPAYVESTVRAYLNNLERFDLGGDAFVSGVGYVPSKESSDKNVGKLLSSVGFSNQIYWTGLTSENAEDANLAKDAKTGLFKREESNSNEICFQRPISNKEYKNRPATRGFYDEAFSNDEKTMIAPKSIAGYTGNRWPDSDNFIAIKSHVDGTSDKVWIPSVTELNIANAQSLNTESNDEWLNSSDDSTSNVFEYFKNYREYKNPFSTLSENNSSVSEAIYSKRTTFAHNSFAANYSIPLYKYNSLDINDDITDIHTTKNSSDHYWTRSPSSYWHSSVRYVYDTGYFGNSNTNFSPVGVRPCVILQY